MTTLQLVPTKDIHAHPLNPRRPVTEADDLVASVKEHGIITPVSLVPDPDGGYFLLAGHRRHFAATTCELAEMPASIDDTLDDKTLMARLMADNLQRQDFTPAEEAAGFQSMLDLGMTATQIAKTVGRTKKHVETHAQASALDARTVDALHGHALDLSLALSLAPVEAEPDLYEATITKIAAGSNAQMVVRDAVATLKSRAGQRQVQAYGEKHSITVLDQAPGYDSRATDITGDTDAIKAHKGMECHAVAYQSYYEPHLRHYCVKPTAHSGGKADAATVSDDERTKSKRRRALVISNNKRFDAVNEVRREWLAQLVVRKTPPRGFLPRLVPLIASESPTGHLRNRTYGPDAIELTALDANAASMALIRATCDAIEATIDRTVWRTRNWTVAHYLQSLAEWGYVLTDSEALYIKAVDKRLDTEDTDFSPAEK